jgi:hypothetical protein
MSSSRHLRHPVRNWTQDWRAQDGMKEGRKEEKNEEGTPGVRNEDVFIWLCVTVVVRACITQKCEGIQHAPCIIRSAGYFGQLFEHFSTFRELLLRGLRPVARSIQTCTRTNMDDSSGNRTHSSTPPPPTLLSLPHDLLWSNVEK